jgi:hypothetical protein
MLVRRSALAGAGGLAGIRGALIDDVALARQFRGRCWLGLTTQVVSVRPYPKLGDLWQMIARSAYTQLRYSPPLLAGTIVGLLFLYAVPPVGAVVGVTTGSALAAWAGVLGWILMSVSYLPMLRFYRLSPLRAPGLPLVALMYAAMTVDSARRYYSGGGAAWKGRTIERGLPSANQFRPGVPPQSPPGGWAVLVRELALVTFKLADDVAMAAALHVVRHAPYVDCPDKTDYADMHGRGVRGAGVVAPVPAVAKKGDSADIDVDAFRYIDIGVTKHDKDGYRGPRLIGSGFAQVEVQISEGTDGEGPPAQPQPPTPCDMAEHRCREAGGLAARASSLDEDLGQVFLDTRQFSARSGPQSGADSPGELLERQPTREKVLAQRGDSLLAVGVRDAHGRIVHNRHFSPQLAATARPGCRQEEARLVPRLVHNHAWLTPLCPDRTWYKSMPRAGACIHISTEA